MPRLLLKKKEEIIAEYISRKNKLKIFIGNKKGNDIVIPDKKVSEHHCTIIFANNQYTLKDQNTIMGTQINYRSITEAPLNFGDEILIGDYKILFLDMDGTTLNSQKKISPRTKLAIENLLKRGVYVVVSTGRGLVELNDYREDFKAMNYGIVISGGLIYDFFKDAPVKVHGLDEEIIFKLIDFGLEERAMIHLHTIKKSVAREEDIQNMAAFDMAIYHDMFNRICERCEDPKKYVQEHPGEVIKVNLYHRDKISRDKNFERISKLNLSISYAEAFNLEMSPANVTKGSGLVELCDFLKIDLTETVAIGDADNDREILLTAGLAVAMGKASDEIKKLADFVTLDNDSDGVAAAIEKIFYA